MEYLLIGGTAFALYGYYRLSMSPAGAVSDKPDANAWYHPTYGNYFQLLKALDALGQDVGPFKPSKRPTRRSRLSVTNSISYHEYDA